jgi:RNA polymerase sigma-70 factor (ECF subfamily)
MLNEKQLVKQCAKHDRRAQKQLFDRSSGLLLGICRRYVAETSEAEDILQEGFLKIYLKIREYKGTGPLMAWMARIIINTAITHYHKNRKHHFHYDIEEVNETDIEGFMFNDLDFTCDELLNVIGSLPQGYRMIFNLYAVEGFKHKEIAELLEIDVNTSKSQYSRARKLIRKKLENLSKAHNIKGKK